MEFSYLRTVLEELRLELGVAFEHGLSHAQRQEQALRACGARLSENGMEAGATIIGALCGQLVQSRLDPHWKADEAAVLFARLWKYTGLCLKRLEFFEAEYNLNH